MFQYSMYDLFISYSHRDTPEAESILNLATKRGLKCFMSKIEIKAGDQFDEKIRQAHWEVEKFVLL